MGMRCYVSCSAIAAAFVLGIQPNETKAADWEIFHYDGTRITQLTDNSYDDWGAQVSGSNITWAGNDKIFFYNGVEATQLGQDNHYAWTPQISGSNVVWTGRSQNGADDDEVYFFDGATVTQLTDNSVHDRDPQVSGSNIVWEHGDQICLYDGNQIVELTNGRGLSPDVSGSNVVWQSSSEIFLWDGTEVRQVTDNKINDRLPKISGSNVVWLADSDGGIDDGRHLDLYFSDGQTITQLTTDSRLTRYDYSYYDISGSSVVWSGYQEDVDWDDPYSGTLDREIFLWNGSKTIQLTDNFETERCPRISGSNVVWEGTNFGFSSEIYLYNGAEITRLTTNNYADGLPEISGSDVVWYGQVPEPANILLLAMGLAIFLGSPSKKLVR